LIIQYKNAVYHIMNRGLNKRDIFYSKKDYLRFYGLIEESYKRWHIEVLAVCLMKNHYHLCIRTPEANLSRVMRHVNGVYTQGFNKAHRQDGPLFRGRYKAIIVEEQEYLAQVIRYIHLNPVTAKIVKNPTDFEWSTHKYYMNKGKVPAWFGKNRIKEWFKSSKDFNDFVMEGNDKFIENVYKRKRWPVVLGTQEFIDEVRKKAGTISKENVREDLDYIRPTVEQVITAVSKIYSIPHTGIFTGIRGESNEARKVAQWLLKEKCDFTYQEIADTFSHGSKKTAAWACNEVKELAKTNKKTILKIKKIEKTLKSN
ncbi:transposase, partial [bacterium]|nr:transposase [bacterium]